MRKAEMVDERIGRAFVIRVRPPNKINQTAIAERHCRSMKLVWIHVQTRRLTWIRDNDIIFEQSSETKHLIETERLLEIAAVDIGMQDLAGADSVHAGGEKQTHGKAQKNEFFSHRWLLLHIVQKTSCFSLVYLNITCLHRLRQRKAFWLWRG
jgi:hypothetical protein